MWLLFEKGAETYCVGIDSRRNFSDDTDDILVVVKADEILDSSHVEFNAWDMTHNDRNGMFTLEFQTDKKTHYSYIMRHPEYLFYVRLGISRRTGKKYVRFDTSDNDAFREHIFPARLQQSLPLFACMLK